MKHRRATALTLTSRYALLAEAVAGRDGVRLERLEAIPFSAPLSRAPQLDLRRVQITEALRTRLGESGVKLGDVVLVLRQMEAKTRFARLPSNNAAEIAQMARFEIEKTIPFDAQRHLSGAVTMRDVGIEGADVLIFAVDGPIVDTAVRGLEHARLGIERTTLSGWGLYALYRDALHREKLAATAAATAAEAATTEETPAEPATPGDEKKPRGEVHLVCNIGMEASNLLLTIDGLPVFLRSSTFGLTRLLAKLRQFGLGRVRMATSEVEVRLDDFESLVLAGAATDATSSTPIRPEMADDRPPPPGADERSGVWAAVPDDQLLAAWVGRFEQEIRRTVEFAGQSQPVNHLDRIFLGGPGAIIHGFAAYLAGRTGSQVTALDPLAGMPPPAPANERRKERLRPADLAASNGATVAGASPAAEGEAPAPATTSASAAAPAAASAALPSQPQSPAELALFCETVGILLDELEPAFPPLDLTPDWYRQRVARGTRRRSLTATGIIAGVLLIVLFAYFSIRHGMQQDYIEAIRADNQRMAPHAELVAEKQEKLGIVRRHVDDKYSAIAVLDMVSSLDVIAQKRARVTKFDFRRGEEVIIKGHAKSYADINDFMDALEKRRDFFSNVENRGTEPVQLSADRQVFRFDFLCYLRSIQSERRTRRSPGLAGGGVTSIGDGS